MKNQKGISLITVIVTVIVIIILASIYMNYSFRKTLDDASSTRQISEMTEVYDAIVQRGIEHRINELMYPLIGTKLSNSNPRRIGDESYGDGYYYIESDSQKAALGLERVRGKYLANYESGEVVSEAKIEYDGKEYYKLSDVSNVIRGESNVTPEGVYDEDKGVNAPILSDGMVPVKEENGSWVVTTEDDDEWYDYENGKYATIMLMDELSLTTATNVEVRKMTRDQLNSLANSKVLVQGSTFVWIPRYTYKQDGGKIDIVYSKLTEDYTQDGYIKSPAFYFGGYSGAETDMPEDANSGYVGGGKELTGIWVSKYEAGFNQ